MARHDTVDLTVATTANRVLAHRACAWFTRTRARASGQHAGEPVVGAWDVGSRSLLGAYEVPTSSASMLVCCYPDIQDDAARGRPSGITCLRSEHSLPRPALNSVRTREVRLRGGQRGVRMSGSAVKCTHTEG